MIKNLIQNLAPARRQDPNLGPDQDPNFALSPGLSLGPELLGLGVKTGWAAYAPWRSVVVAHLVGADSAYYSAAACLG